MQQENDQKISWEIYHRIYRLALKNVDAQSIAATLQLPLRTVNIIMERFSANKKRKPADPADSGADARIKKTRAAHELSIKNQSFLDVYILSKARYAVIDLSGMVTEEHLEKLKKEIGHLAASTWKAVAILMADVIVVDEKGMAEIIRFHNEFSKRNRFVGLLDPSPAIEPFIEKHKLDEKIPIFGTEKVFEEKAFALTKTIEKKSLK
jgi:anti-anti-sigma regulatory factor